MSVSRSGKSRFHVTQFSGGSLQAQYVRLILIDVSTFVERVAPEVLNYEPISLATDMWSVGVLAYVLLTGCTPFGGDSKQETFCNITRCQLEFPEDLFQDVSPAAIQFISCLLVQDPRYRLTDVLDLRQSPGANVFLFCFALDSARLTAQQCLEHPWLRGGSLLDSMHMVISSSPSDSCPVSRSSTIVPDDDDDDDVARCFRDDTSSTSEETIVCGGSNRLGTPTGDPPPEAETELLDAETLSLVSAAAAASCRAADVVDTPGAPAVAATAAATAATAPNRDEDELKRSEVKSKLLAVREDFGLAWLSPKTTPSASAMKKQHLDYVSPPAATSSAWSNFGVTRRTGSLPSYRWRTSANAAAAAAAAAANRREASCDRTSDLGYGSDGVSEISSTDSSSDRSSIISLDDSPLEWANHPSAPRRYSDTSLAAERLWRRTWERFLPATAGTCVSLPYHLYRDQKQETGRDDRRGGPCQQPGSLLRSGSSVTCSSSSAAGSADPNGQSNNLHRRPWEKLCTGSLARAMERFNSPPPSSTVSSADGETAEATSAVGSSSQSTVAAALSTPLSSKVGSPLKVSEVRTRLLRSSSGACLSRPSGAFRTGSSSATYIKAPLLHLDQTEIVKSRLVKFRTAQATTSPAASAASATAANAVHPPSSS